MLEDIGNFIKVRQPHNLSDVLQATDEFFSNFRASHPHIIIVLVSAAINADGPQHRKRNVQHLLQKTRQLQAQRQDNAFFCSEMIFDDNLREMIALSQPTYDDLVAHWPKVIGLPKRHISKIVFLPGFERSPGARAEHEAAICYNIERYYLSD